MKKVKLSKQFKKCLKQRYAHQPNVLKRYEKNVDLFLAGERGSPLNDHRLIGGLAGRRAFSIGGDVRVVYQELDEYYLFLDIGSHNQVY